MSFRLAVSLGDPRGIGREVSLRALDRLQAEAGPVPTLLIGSDEAPARLPEETVFESTGSFDGSEAGAGAASLAAIEAGVRACLEGRAEALVTAPIHKGALAATGSPFPGHTELLRSLTDSVEVGMLMDAESLPEGRSLRVLLATTHLPLRDVPDRVTSALLESQALLLERELRSRWGIDAPRLALCALNPHASDGGLFGDEEVRVYGPAIAALRERGIPVPDPVPADTVFTRALRGEFDAVVAPYHDVGMAAFKTASFGRGVNVTLGLPFVRTSPDHGTAFDLAGTGRADPSSTLEAMRLALRLTRSHLSRNASDPRGPAQEPAPAPS